MGVHFAPQQNYCTRNTASSACVLFIRCKVAFFRGIGFVARNVQSSQQVWGLVRSPQA